MKGIVLTSHGQMCEGLYHTASFFFGEEMEQVTSCALRMDDAPEDYAARLAESIAKVDTGDGVIILADLFGGTPCNQAILQLGEKNELIGGMNLPMLMELLNSREDAPAELVETGKAGVVDVRAMLSELSADEEDM